jgi:hypothetical protein
MTAFRLLLVLGLVHSFAIRSSAQTAPAQKLAATPNRHGRRSPLKIYPAVGETAAEGHNMVFLAGARWEQEIFTFWTATSSIDRRLRLALPRSRRSMLSASPTA